MSSRRRRYPKRSEVEGPPPNYGVESGDESEQEESSSDEVEEGLTDEREDSNQSDMVRTGKECKVDMPSLRVERGSSEDMVVKSRDNNKISEVEFVRSRQGVWPAVWLARSTG